MPVENWIEDVTFLGSRREVPITFIENPLVHFNDLYTVDKSLTIVLDQNWVGLKDMASFVLITIVILFGAVHINLSTNSFRLSSRLFKLDFWYGESVLGFSATA